MNRSMKTFVFLRIIYYFLHTCIFQLVFILWVEYYPQTRVSSSLMEYLIHMALCHIHSLV